LYIFEQKTFPTFLICRIFIPANITGTNSSILNFCPYTIQYL